jgi:hypothetical protein
MVAQCHSGANSAKMKRIVETIETMVGALKVENARLREQLSITLEMLMVMQEELQAAHDELGPPKPSRPPSQ